MNVLLPGLTLTSASKDIVVPDDVKSLMNNGSIVLFLKKLDGTNLSLFCNQKIFLEATYKSRGTPSDNGASEENTTDEADENNPVEEEERILGRRN